jgi:uncharacterized membrane protein YhaH (DUF805 family)
MTPPSRALRMLVLVVALVVIGTFVITLVVRDYEVATVLLTCVSALLFLASIVTVFVRRKDDAGLRNASLSYYLNPSIGNIALAVFYSVMVIGALTLGIGFLSIGNVIGWGLVLCGGAGLVSLIFEIWVARQPVDDFPLELGPEQEWREEQE